MEAVRTFTDYKPSNLAYGIAPMTMHEQALKTAEADLMHAQQALDEAINNLIAAQWLLHNGVLGMREQVIAQYGRSSNQVEKMGLKRKTEYNTPSSPKLPDTK